MQAKGWEEKIMSMSAKIYCSKCDYYDCRNSSGIGSCHKNAPDGNGFASVNGDIDWCSEFKTDITKLHFEEIK